MPLQKVLRDERALMVLAAVDSLYPIYKEVNTYPNVLEDGVTGNPDGLKPHELHGKAWGVVQPYFLKTRRRAADLFDEWKGTGRASDRLEDILPAGYQGRIDSLFIIKDVEQWGRFDPDSLKVEIHTQRQPGGADLFDAAAIQTLMHRGEIYAVYGTKCREENPSPPSSATEVEAPLLIHRYSLT